jgi:CRP-like cAMP-binding protein
LATKKTSLNSAALTALESVVNGLVAPPQAQWEDFASCFSARELARDDYFLHAGDVSEWLCFVNSGLLRFFYLNADGKEFNKSFSRENDFAGAYSAWLTGEPARFSIQALEPCYLLQARFDEIVALFETHACWQKLGRLLAEQLYIRKEQREAEFLLDDAETRYRNFKRQYPGLESRLAQYHVAGYLGITAVALSRIRSRMR